MKNKKSLLGALLVIPMLVISMIAPIKTNASTGREIETVNVAKDEVIEKTFFASGDYVNIDGTIDGDAFVFGDNVTITGTINGNLFTAANILNVSGSVDGTIFAAGNTVTISSEEAKNVFAAGNLLSISAKIKKNLYLAGNNLTISNAEVEKDSFIGGNLITAKLKSNRDLDVAGTKINADVEVGRDAKIDADYIVFGENSKIGNNLNVYKEALKEDLTIDVGGEITFLEREQIEYVNPIKKMILHIAMIVLFGMFTSLVIGLILIKVYSSKVINELNKDIKTRFFSNFGKGLVVFLLSTLAILGLMITVIGIKISIFVAVLLSAAIFIGNVIAPIFIGWLILGLSKKKEHSAYAALLLGTVIYVLISTIPFIGFVMKMIMIPTCIGALFTFKQQMIKKMQA